MEKSVPFLYHNCIKKEVLIMKTITITDFRRRQGYYLNLSRFEDIHVTKHGKVICVISNPNKRSNRVGSAKKELEGVDTSLETLNSIPIDNFYGDD